MEEQDGPNVEAIGSNPIGDTRNIMVCLVCGIELRNIYPDDIEKPGAYDGTRYVSSYLSQGRYETLVLCDSCNESAKSEGRLVVVSK